MLLFCLLINKRIAVRRMNPRTDNVTENHSTNIKIYYLTNSGRRAQINATTGSYQFDAFYSRHSQQTQQYPKDRCGRRSEQTTGSSKRRKEKDSFQFHFCMLMLPFKRMRVYDNHPIYHMRVSKKRRGRMRKVMQIFRIRKIGSLLLVLLALVPPEG